MSDHFSAADVAAIAACVDLDALPLRRGETVFAVPGEPPRRMRQHELADELRDAGLSSLARRVACMLVPRDHVLLVVAGVDVGLRVLPVTAPPAREGSAAMCVDRVYGRGDPDGEAARRPRYEQNWRNSELPERRSGGSR